MASDVTLVVAASALPHILTAEKELIGIDLSKTASFLANVTINSLEFEGTVAGVSTSISVTPNPPVSGK